ncbi:peptidase M15 [Streptomyces chartreusis]|nr:peptidase M15 [Streptomyces chartreusis]
MPRTSRLPGTSSRRIVRLLLGEPRGPLGEADGAVPDGVTVFDGVEFYVSSGWRSPEYQDQLLREAVAEYGSEDEAARWVATATTSPHVAGDAVDIGRSDATEWLSRHGAEHGLCQIYRNEPWHYELRTEAIEHGCPRMYADPTQDPRMQQ